MRYIASIVDMLLRGQMVNRRRRLHTDTEAGVAFRVCINCAVPY